MKRLGIEFHIFSSLLLLIVKSEVKTEWEKIKQTKKTGKSDLQNKQQNRHVIHRHQKKVHVTQCRWVEEEKEKAEEEEEEKAEERKQDKRKTKKSLHVNTMTM